MFMLPAKTNLHEFVEEISGKPYSRIPIYGENVDDITGVVIRAEALLGAVKDKDKEWELANFRREVIRVESTSKVDELMRKFLDEGHHFALVTDRFGTVTGLVTLEDILETVVGVEIMDESDEVADLQEVARKLWRERAQKKGVGSEELAAMSEAGEAG